MNTHVLKTDRDAFQAVISGKKKYEIRLDDRGFEVGDRLDLLETVSTGAEMKAGDVLEYTSGQHLAIVMHILRGPIYGLAQGWVIMSIEQDTSLTLEVSEAGQAEAAYRDGVLAAAKVCEAPIQELNITDAVMKVDDYFKGFKAAIDSRTRAIRALLLKSGEQNER